MNYTLTDGAYHCAECDKVSGTLLAHNSHYRRHKNAAAKATVVTPVVTQTTRRVISPAVAPVAPVEPVAATPAPARRGWIDRLLYGDDD